MKSTKTRFPSLPTFPKSWGRVMKGRHINVCAMQGVWASKLEGLMFKSMVRHKRCDLGRHPISLSSSPSGKIRTIIPPHKVPGVTRVKKWSLLKKGILVVFPVLI